MYLDKMLDWINIKLQHPLIDTIANRIKQFKSSKDYWFVTYLLILWIIRESIVIIWSDKVIKISQENLADKSISIYEKVFWNAFEFLFANGAWWLLAIFIFLFLVISIVKVSESDKQSVSIKENFLTVFLLISLIGISTYQLIVSSQHNEATKQKVEQDGDLTRSEIRKLHELLTELQISSNKEKFLQEFFGDDWKQALENPQTYQNLKNKLAFYKGNIQHLIEEKQGLLKKIKSRQLDEKIQKQIDKAFSELRFQDVRKLLNTFIENNRDTERNFINAHYQKALSYMQEVKYHEAKEEFERYIPVLYEDVDILTDYGTTYQVLGEYDKAIDLYNKALSLILSEKDSTKVATIYNGLGFVYDSKGNYDKAIEYYSKALNIYLTTVGKNHSDIAVIYNNIGSTWNKKGEYDTAVTYYFKALKIWTNAFGENHPNTATTYNNIGSSLQNKQQYDKAMKYYSRALTILIATLGKNHPNVAATYNNKGLIWHVKKEYANAIKSYSKALTIYLTIVGENHLDTAITYNNMAISHYEMGDYKKSYECMQKAVKIRRSLLPKNHPERLKSQQDLESIQVKLIIP